MDNQSLRFESAVHNGVKHGAELVYLGGTKRLVSRLHYVGGRKQGPQYIYDRKGLVAACWNWHRGKMRGPQKRRDGLFLRTHTYWLDGVSLPTHPPPRPTPQWKGSPPS